ncbi:Threonine synthase [Falsiruegeria litorea R37]|uniref:Threonine synthase n=2 Tax=Falsiruegeria litorea TaxID=1280831 RepID=A0A1Y5RFJ5_9RHOB|nr:Threonine synthase [Falsiruegeria litorea R37]
MKAPTFVDPRNGTEYALDAKIWRSADGNPMMISPLPGICREDIDTGNGSLWRYQAAFPIKVENPVSMGEGCTPMHKTSFDGIPCNFKLEWFSPTGSFKDRGTSVMLSMLKEMGITEVLEDSSGNGGASVAGYGAAAGMKVHVFVPATTSAAKVAQIQAYGAEIVRVPGPREATEEAAIEKASEIFYASHNWHPFFLQGTKTIGYEIWEDLGFKLPDNIVIPGSAGSNVLGVYLAFKELMASGETDRLPKIFVSQPANCAPLHAAFQAEADEHVLQEFGKTVAEGTAIKRPIRIKEMLQAVRESGGGTVAVEEDDIIAACRKLANQGLYVEPTCAHAAAGLAKLTQEGLIKETDETVVILTGSGLKTTSFYADLFSGGDA